MIINALCNTCFGRFDIMVEPRDVRLLSSLDDGRNLGPCPRGCGGKINLRQPSSEALGAMMSSQLLKDPVRLSAQELFRAAKGGGLPDEIPQSQELVEALFKAHPVKEVVLETDGPAIYLHEVRFEGGTVLHLAAGRRGSQILKVTKGG